MPKMPKVPKVPKILESQSSISFYSDDVKTA